MGKRKQYAFIVLEIPGITEESGGWEIIRTRLGVAIREVLHVQGTVLSVSALFYKQERC